MLIAAVAAAALVGWAPDDRPEDLVARLGSPRYAEREAAAEALKRLGRPALPALRKAQSGRDLEIRLRAANLRDEIESMTLLEPTRARLDFRDRPLSELVEAIGRRAGVSLIAGDASVRARPSGGPSWPDRRITLEAPEPVLFWEAIDRLGRAGGLQRIYPQGPFASGDLFDRLTLVPGEAAPPRSDSGAFRVELVRIRRERDLDLAPGLSQYRFYHRGFGPALPGDGREGEEARTSSFDAELVLSVEPRLRILGEPSLERLKAIDGRGRSVLREPTAAERKARDDLVRMNPHLDPTLHPELRFGPGSRRSEPSRLLSIPLDDSASPGGRLAELGGVIAVAVMGRRADPLVVSLKDAGGPTIENDGVRLTIHEAVVPPSQFGGELELTLETETPAETLKVQGSGIAPVPIPRPLDLIEREIEILDDQGQPILWSFLRPPPGGLRGRMRLQVRPRDHGERLDFSGLRLRVSTMIGAAAEVPFSFTDVPMP